MNIMRTLTRKHLLSNKSRTIVTIMGITISVAMITAVFVAMASFFDFFGNIARLTDGNQEVTFFHRSYDQVEELKTDPRIHQIGSRLEDDSQSGFILKGDGAIRKRIGNIYTCDSIGLEQIVSCDYEGRLPENLTEIAVEESFLIRNDINTDDAIGKELTVSVGCRSWDDGNEVKTYVGNYQEDEIWTQKEDMAFTITAVLHNNPATKAGYKILRGISKEELQEIAQNNIAAMISLNQVDYRSDAMIDQMVEEYHVDKSEKNTDILDSCFSLRLNSAFARMIPLIMVVLCIIILASVVLIYNAFAMSLAERVKYLGMLASVGATKKQKRFSVYYEGFLLGIVGIPLGILAGIGGISITLKVVSRLMQHSDMIPSLAENQDMVSLSTIVPVGIIPVIVGFSIITIALASFVPAKRASLIMPIDAIRQTTQIKIKSKKIKVPAYVKVIFGYEGELAYKNLKRNAGKARIITASIATSIILFFSVNCFCELFWTASEGTFSFPFQIIATVKYQQGEEFKEEVEAIQGVDEVNSMNMIIYEYKVGSEKSPNLQFIDSKNFKSKYQKKYANGITVSLVLLEDEDFALLCQHNGLDKEKYYETRIKAALCNNVTYTKNGKEIFSDEIIGEKMFYDDKEKYNAAEIEIADFVKWEDNDHLFGMHGTNIATAFVPLSQYVKVLYGDDIPDGFTMDYGIYTEQKSFVYERILDIYNEGNYENGFCQNISDDTSAMNAVMYVLEIFTYGFITLITLITIANIVNSISTGIALRRKEFAMLKSVGMTQKGFMKMLRLETFLYGIWALIIGIPISLVIEYLMTKSLQDDLPFQPNLQVMTLVIVTVFVILGITMAGAISKLRKDHIIDVLKTEIL